MKLSFSLLAVSFCLPCTDGFLSQNGVAKQLRNVLFEQPFSNVQKIAISTLISAASNISPNAATQHNSAVADSVKVAVKKPTQSQSKSQSTKYYSSSENDQQTTSQSNTQSSSTFIREAVRNVGPSVVRIDCEREVTNIMSILAPDSGMKEGDFVRVSGSGFVTTEDGYILTNAHVVDKAKKITITLSNGRSFKANLIACDELTDLAVLKVDFRGNNIKLKKAPLGDSSKLQAGDWLIAVGCPAGLDFTVTLGIVSSPKRSAHDVGAHHLKGSYIQTDASLNSGNSGGPLVNDRGEVVGINTMVRSNSEAIGFAIPINRAVEVFEILKEGRKPTHAFFGLELTNITPDSARIHNDDPNAAKLPSGIKGALIVRVVPSSPAAEASFRKNDVITEINGVTIKDMSDADHYLDISKIGANSHIKIVRGENNVVHDVYVSPFDLHTLLEERKMKKMMEFFKVQQ